MVAVGGTAVGGTAVGGTAVAGPEEVLCVDCCDWLLVCWVCCVDCVCCDFVSPLDSDCWAWVWDCETCWDCCAGWGAAAGCEDCVWAGALEGAPPVALAVVPAPPVPPVVFAGASALAGSLLGASLGASLLGASFGASLLAGSLLGASALAASCLGGSAERAY